MNRILVLGKARLHKYYKRIPKKSGKGWDYFYTKTEYEKQKRGEPIEPAAKQKAIGESIMSIEGMNIYKLSETAIAIEGETYKNLEHIRAVREDVGRKGNWNAKQKLWIFPLDMASQVMGGLEDRLWTDAKDNENTLEGDKAEANAEQLQKLKNAIPMGQPIKYEGKEGIIIRQNQLRTGRVVYDVKVDGKEYNFVVANDIEVLPEMDDKKIVKKIITVTPQTRTIVQNSLFGGIPSIDEPDEPTIDKKEIETKQKHVAELKAQVEAKKIEIAKQLAKEMADSDEVKKLEAQIRAKEKAEKERKEKAEKDRVERERERGEDKEKRKERTGVQRLDFELWGYHAKDIVKEITGENRMWKSPDGIFEITRSLAGDSYMVMHHEDRPWIKYIRGKDGGNIVGAENTIRAIKEYFDIKEKDRIEREKNKEKVKKQSEKIESEIDSRPGVDFKPESVEYITPAGNAFKMDDYSPVMQKDVFISNEKTILNEPRPAFIPYIEQAHFSRIKNRLEFIQITDEKYIMLNPTSSVGIVGAEEKQIFKNAKIVTAAVAVATQEYYYKFAKAKKKEKIESDRKELIEIYIKRGKSQSDAEKIVSHRVPSRIVITKMKKNVARRVHFRAIEALDPTLDSGLKQSRKLIEIYKTLNYKLGDIQIQQQDDNNTYSKGEETSYGDTNLKSTILKSHGVKVKRQNGDVINTFETRQIKESLNELYTVFGDRSEMAKQFGLKISHSGGKGMHARKSVGLFFPKYKAIGVSASGGPKDFGFTLAHEFGHFMDYYTARKKGNTYRYSSDNWVGGAGSIATKFRKNMAKTQTSDYQNRTCECFARALSQYYYIKTGNEKELEPEINKFGFYPKNEYFKKEIVPMIDKWINDNEQLLKSGINDVRKYKLVFISKGERK